MVRSILFSLVAACLAKDDPLGLVQLKSGSTVDKLSKVNKMAAAFQAKAQNAKGKGVKAKGATHTDPFDYAEIRALMDAIRSDAASLAADEAATLAAIITSMNTLQDTRDNWIADATAPHNHTSVAGSAYHWNLFTEKKSAHCEKRVTEHSAFGGWTAAIAMVDSFRDNCFSAFNNPTVGCASVARTPAEAESCMNRAQQWATDCQSLEQAINARNIAGSAWQAKKSEANAAQQEMETQFNLYGDNLVDVCNVFKERYDAKSDAEYPQASELAAEAQVNIFSLVIAAAKIDCYLDVIENGGAGLDHCGGLDDTPACTDAAVQCLNANINGQPGDTEVPSHLDFDCTFDEQTCNVAAGSLDAQIFDASYLTPYHVFKPTPPEWTACDATKIANQPCDGAAAWGHLTCDTVACKSSPMQTVSSSCLEFAFLDGAGRVS